MSDRSDRPVLELAAEAAFNPTDVANGFKETNARIDLVRDEAVALAARVSELESAHQFLKPLSDPQRTFVFDFVETKDRTIDAIGVTGQVGPWDFVIVVNGQQRTLGRFLYNGGGRFLYGGPHHDPKVELQPLQVRAGDKVQAVVTFDKAVASGSTVSVELHGENGRAVAAPPVEDVPKGTRIVYTQHSDTAVKMGLIDANEPRREFRFEFEQGHRTDAVTALRVSSGATEGYSCEVSLNGTLALTIYSQAEVVLSAPLFMHKGDKVAVVVTFDKPLPPGEVVHLKVTRRAADEQLTRTQLGQTLGALHVERQRREDAERSLKDVQTIRAGELKHMRLVVEERDRARGQVTTLQELLKRSQETLDSVHDNLARDRASNRELRTANEQLAKRNDAISREVVAAVSERNVARRSLEELRTANEQFTKRNAQLSRELVEVISQRDAAREQVRIGGENRAALIKQVKQLQEDLAVARADHAAALYDRDVTAQRENTLGLQLNRELKARDALLQERDRLKTDLIGARDAFALAKRTTLLSVVEHLGGDHAHAAQMVAALDAGAAESWLRNEIGTLVDLHAERKANAVLARAADQIQSALRPKGGA